MEQKKKIKKMSLANKFVLRSFLSVVPSIIDLWKGSNTDLTFDEWLLSVCQVKK